MSTPAKGNISFQVTLSKAVYDDINGIVEAINELREQENQPKITRSQFIETLVQAFIISNTKTAEEIEKAKEEMKNNA